MRRSLVALALVAIGCVTAATTMPEPQEDKIQQAMSAAPPEIAARATIMDWPSEAGGEPRLIRQGDNGWVCFPMTPEASEAVGEDPMCIDSVWQSWVGAWVKREQPSVDRVGIAYMLRGDIGVSNNDPYANAPTPQNEWVRTGPHIMVIVPDVSALAAMPTSPEAGGPWVMWSGTPYAHIMVPVAAPK